MKPRAKIIPDKLFFKEESDEYSTTNSQPGGSEKF